MINHWWSQLFRTCEGASMFKIQGFWTEEASLECVKLSYLQITNTACPLLPKSRLPLWGVKLGADGGSWGWTLQPIAANYSLNKPILWRSSNKQYKPAYIPIGPVPSVGFGIFASDITGWQKRNAQCQCPASPTRRLQSIGWRFDVCFSKVLIGFAQKSEGFCSTSFLLKHKRPWFLGPLFDPWCTSTSKLR